ncbi:hypothetical protein IAD21_03492 [Abditibacteriota bacterium]|nr:hypothetical protein IAD21_03492 [Abditibacteriota bacterium]
MNERDSHLSSRRAFLGRGALAGGVMAVGALALPALPAHALDFSYGDARLLAFLLEVQEMQSEFFTRAALTMIADGLTAGEANSLNVIAKQDGEQKRWCKLALRKFAVSQNGLPSTMSGGFGRKHYTFASMSTRESILREALRLKTAAVSAWTGAAGDADEGQIASAFASLAGVQSRHRSIIANALGEPALMAMAPTLSVRDARRALEHFGMDTAS